MEEFSEADYTQWEDTTISIGGIGCVKELMGSTILLRYSVCYRLIPNEIVNKRPMIKSKESDSSVGILKLNSNDGSR